jgi:GNAT superfamily N-acetyltransferase
MKVAYLNEAPIGFVQNTPARFFPRVKEYASGPPAENAILITCLYIVDRKARGRGIGPDILRKLLSDLRQKSVETVETFAGKGSANNPSGPLKLYLKHGFKVKNEKDDFPLVRLES